MGIHKKAAAASDSDGGSVIPSPPPCRAEIEIRSRMGGGAQWKGKNQFFSAWPSSSSSSSSAHTSSSCWSRGAKRNKSESEGESESESSARRDWANLGDGPAGVIADLALARDVADYIRFRAVCRPWRRCSPDPTGGDGDGLDARFLPRQWMMLDKALATTRRRRFLNVSTGECIRMDLPELAEYWLLSLTPEGLLLLFHHPSLSLHLLNPLTRRLTHLPPFQKIGILLPQVESAGLIHHHDQVTVAVNFHGPFLLAVAKPSDDSWTVVDAYEPRLSIDSTLPFAGRFYCTTAKGVMELHISSSSSDQKPRLVMVAEPPMNTSIPWYPEYHLVDKDNGQELMLVHRLARLPFYHFQVYRVDLDAGTLIPVKGYNISGRALFVGRGRAIQVSTQVFPSLNADILYLGFDCFEKATIDAYDFANGSIIKPPRQYQHDPSKCLSSCIKDNGPPTIADCLSDCIQGNGFRLSCGPLLFWQLMFQQSTSLIKRRAKVEGKRSRGSCSSLALYYI